MRLETRICEDAFNPTGHNLCRSKMLHVNLPVGWLMDGEDVMKFKADTRQHVLLFSAIKQLRYHRSTQQQNVSCWHSAIKPTAKILRWARLTLCESKELTRSDNCNSSSTITAHVRQERSARHLSHQSKISPTEFPSRKC